MKRPVYKLVIDIDDEGMDFIGLVDFPAHGKNYVTMSKLSKKIEPKFQFNEEQQIVTGVAIATDLLIYRVDPNGFEYDVFITKDDALTIMKMFAKRGYHNNVNLMHDMDSVVKDAFMIGCYFINDKRTNIPEEFKNQNLRPGSLIFSYWIEGAKTWEFVKDNGAGFSLEGWFQEVEVKFMKTKKAIVKVKNPKKFATVTEISKWDIEVIESDIAIGTELTHIPWEGQEPAKLNDGEYLWDGHTIQVDSNGIVVMIDGQTENVSLKKQSKMKKSLLERLGFKKDKPVFDKENKDKYAEATTVDGDTVMWEGDLAAGTPIFVVSEDGEAVLAPAGDLSFEVDGVLMVVSVDEAGLITNVEEAEELEEEDDKETEAALIAMKADYDKKFEAQEKSALEQTEQIKTMASAIDDLTDAVEKMSEGKPPKKVKSGGTPAWKKMKNNKKK